MQLAANPRRVRRKHLKIITAIVTVINACFQTTLPGYISPISWGEERLAEVLRGSNRRARVALAALGTYGGHAKEAELGRGGAEVGERAAES